MVWLARDDAEVFTYSCITVSARSHTTAPFCTVTTALPFCA